MQSSVNSYNLRERTAIKAPSRLQVSFKKARTVRKKHSLAPTNVRRRGVPVANGARGRRSDDSRRPWNSSVEALIKLLRKEGVEHRMQITQRLHRLHLFIRRSKKKTHNLIHQLFRRTGDGAHRKNLRTPQISDSYHLIDNQFPHTRPSEPQLELQESIESRENTEYFMDFDNEVVPDRVQATDSTECVAEITDRNSGTSGEEDTALTAISPVLSRSLTDSGELFEAESDKKGNRIRPSPSPLQSNAVITRSEDPAETVVVDSSNQRQTGEQELLRSEMSTERLIRAGDSSVYPAILGNNPPRMETLSEASFEAETFLSKKLLTPSRSPKSNPHSSVPYERANHAAPSDPIDLTPLAVIEGTEGGARKLINVGLTCPLNALIHFISSSQLLISVLGKCKRTPFVQLLERVVRHVIDNNNCQLDRKVLVELHGRMVKEYSDFKAGVQHDVEEMYAVIVGGMVEESGEQQLYVKAEATETCGMCSHKLSCLEEKTVVLYLTREPTLNLSIGKLVSKYEQHDKRCGACRCSRSVFQKALTDIPKIIVTAIQRANIFDKKTKTGFYDTKRMEVPEQIDFSQSLCHPSTARIANLRAAILREGELTEEGHYTILLRAKNNQYTLIDDAFTIRLTPKEASDRIARYGYMILWGVAEKGDEVIPTEKSKSVSTEKPVSFGIVNIKVGGKWSDYGKEDLSRQLCSVGVFVPKNGINNYKLAPTRRRDVQSAVAFFQLAPIWQAKVRKLLYSQTFPLKLTTSNLTTNGPDPRTWTTIYVVEDARTEIWAEFFFESVIEVFDLRKERIEVGHLVISWDEGGTRRRMEKSNATDSENHELFEKVLTKMGSSAQDALRRWTKTFSTRR